MEWIKCSDQLPELDQEILCIFIDEDIKKKAYYFIGLSAKDDDTDLICFLKWDAYFEVYRPVEVTHWMPLVKPSK